MLLEHQKENKLGISLSKLWLLHWERNLHVRDDCADARQEVLHVSLVQVADISNPEAGSISHLAGVDHLVYKYIGI